LARRPAPERRSDVQVQAALADGDDLGEATYAMMIKLDEEILIGNGRRFRVLDVVPFEEEDESAFVGLLQV
jgi:hypothetical protein